MSVKTKVTVPVGSSGIDPCERDRVVKRHRSSLLDGRFELRPLNGLERQLVPLALEGKHAKADLLLDSHRRTPETPRSHDVAARSSHACEAREAITHLRCVARLLGAS